MNFAPAPGCVPTAHFITSVEAAIHQCGVDENVAAKARMNVIGAVSRAKMPSRNITSKELNALKELANDEDILSPSRQGQGHMQ